MSAAVLAPLRGEVVDPSARLAELAEVIVRQHELALEAGRAMLDHALACGDALLEAKSLIPPGEWTSWLRANLPDQIRITMTRQYIRLAALREHVDPDLSIRSNLQLLAGIRAFSTGTPKHPEATKAEVLRLWATGAFNYSQIAREVGVAKSTVHAWIEPAYGEAKNARSYELARQRRLERRPELAIAVREDRAYSYGEPGRAAIGQAVRRLAQVQGKTQTREALLDLAAICERWAQRLGAPLPGGAEAEREAHAV